MFPDGGCPVPEFLASGTASAVSKRVYGGADANRTIAMTRGKFSELRLANHRSGHWWLLPYAITLKVTAPRALERSIRLT